MADKYEHRYLFTVRQAFGMEPEVDAFYEVRVPPNITSEQAKLMIKLDERWQKQEISEDTHALHGMQTRIRLNQDMFQKVCLVRTTIPITSEELNLILHQKYSEGILLEFLTESAIG